MSVLTITTLVSSSGTGDKVWVVTSLRTFALALVVTAPLITSVPQAKAIWFKSITLVWTSTDNSFW